MDERLNKLLWLIQSLPSDQIVIIAEKCKGLWEISPKVQKLISVFDKLSDEEKDQFFRNVKPHCDDNSIPGWPDSATISEESESWSISSEGE